LDFGEVRIILKGDTRRGDRSPTLHVRSKGDGGGVEGSKIPTQAHVRSKGEPPVKSTGSQKVRA
jgi:hypothetical protein